jgi:hypothetical protein
MTISRRKFTQLAAMSGASFACSSGIFFPKPAEAFIFPLLLRMFSSRMVFGSLVRYAAGRTISNYSGGSSGPSDEELLKIQLADKDFVERQFSRNRTDIARVNSTILWGQERQDLLGTNVGLGFVQKYQDELSVAKLSGPTVAALHLATKVLADSKLTPSEIADSLLPMRSQYDDWGTWEGDKDPSQPNSPGNGVSLSSYRTLLGSVSSRYDLIQPGRNGRGEIQLIIEAGDQPRREINVNVKFS